MNIIILKIAFISNIIFLISSLNPENEIRDFTLSNKEEHYFVNDMSEDEFIKKMLNHIPIFLI